MNRSLFSPAFVQIFLLSGIIFFSLVRSAQSHIESGPMPDAVAEMEYRILLEFSPEDCTVRNKLGMILLRKNKVEEAAGEFSRILTLKPSDFDALDGMGLVLSRQQKDTEAIDYFKRALAVNAQDLQVYYHLGQALLRVGDLAQAEIAFMAGIELVNSTATTARSGNDSMYRKALEEVRLRMKVNQ